MRHTIIALLLLVSGAAAAGAQPAKQNTSSQAPQKGHCAIGVISHLGETLHVRKSDLSYYDSEVPIESWHVDDLVVDRIRVALGNRVVVQRIPYRKDVEVEARRSFGLSMPLAVLSGTYAREVLPRLTTGTRCARYVSVGSGSEYIGEENNLVGLGIRINTIFIRSAYVHAVIDLMVHDGETFSFLRSAVGIAPHRKVDESFWPDPPTSAAQNAKLRDVTRELVSREMDALLPKLLPTLTSRNERQ